MLHLNNGWKLAGPNFIIDEDIDMLIGSSLFWEIIGSKHIFLIKSLSFLRDSELDWIVAGNLNLSSQYKDYSVCNLNTDHGLYLDKLLNNFIEQVQANKCIQFYRKVSDFAKIISRKLGMTRHKMGRFIVEMPFKENLCNLVQTKDMTLKILFCILLYNLEKRLNTNQNLKKEYSAIFNEYESLGHMNEICLEENQYDEGYSFCHIYWLRNFL